MTKKNKLNNLKLDKECRDAILCFSVFVYVLIIFWVIWMSYDWAVWSWVLFGVFYIAMTGLIVPSVDFKDGEN